MVGKSLRLVLTYCHMEIMNKIHLIAQHWDK